LSTSDGRHHLRLPEIEVAPGQLLRDDRERHGCSKQMRRARHRCV
jgi:hypothetical protein